MTSEIPKEDEELAKELQKQEDFLYLRNINRKIADIDVTQLV
jgi:hypothetical protein